MKKMIIAAMALLTVCVSAQARERVRTEQPQIQMYVHLNGLYFVNYDRVCLDGDKLRTIEPMKVCVEFKRRNGRIIRTNGDRGTKVCKTYENKFVATSLEYVRNKCVNWNRKPDGSKKCSKWEEQTYEHPLEYTKKEVLYKYNRSQNKWRWARDLSSEEFVVPNCN